MAERVKTDKQATPSLDFRSHHSTASPHLWTRPFEDATEQSLFPTSGSLLPTRGWGDDSQEEAPAPNLQAQLEAATRLQQNRANMTIFPRQAATVQPKAQSKVQPKLTVGEPDDPYEREADAVAEQVMSMAPPATPPVQRQSESGLSEPPAWAANWMVQRQAEERENGPIPAVHPFFTHLVQREPIPDLPGSTPSPDLENRLANSQGSGSPLPDDVRSFMEPRFGTDFSQVKVHTGSDAVQMNRELGAQAFTHGSHIYYGAGKAPAKDKLTGHELTHVVQQTGKAQTKPSVRTKYAECASENPTIQRDSTPAPAPAVSPPSPPPPGSPAPAPQNETDTGLVGVRIPLIPLHPGWGDKLTPVDINVDQTLLKIPVPELGSTLDASFGFSMKVELYARLNPIFMENVEVKMTKLTALAVGGSILLIPTLGPRALMTALGLGYFTGQGDLIVTGKVGIDAKISGYTKFALNAVGSKKLSLAEYKLGLDGGVGAELNAGLFDRTAFTLDNGHLTFKKGNKLFLSPQLQAYLAAYIETSFLMGLISGRLSKKWNYKKGWDFAWKPEGGIDIDYDNGLKAKSLDKVFDIDFEKIKSLAKKTGAAVDFLEKLMQDGEQPNEVKDDKVNNNLPDNRTGDDKEKAADQALQESENLLSNPNTTPETVVAKLPTIKDKYRLTEIRLVRVSTSSKEYHIYLEINPKRQTLNHPLKVDQTLEKAQRIMGVNLFTVRQLSNSLGTTEAEAQDFIRDWLNQQQLFKLTPQSYEPNPSQFSFDKQAATVFWPSPGQLSSLQWHESFGGHTMARHVNITDESVKRRSIGDWDARTKWISHSTAAEKITSTCNSYKTRIERWYVDSSPGNKFDELKYIGTPSSPIGYGFWEYGGEFVQDNAWNAQFVLKRINNQWYVLTAYPIFEK